MNVQQFEVSHILQTFNALPADVREIECRIRHTEITPRGFDAVLHELFKGSIPPPTPSQYSIYPDDIRRYQDGTLEQKKQIESSKQQGYNIVISTEKHIQAIDVSEDRVILRRSRQRWSKPSQELFSIDLTLSSNDNKELREIEVEYTSNDPLTRENLALMAKIATKLLSLLAPYSQTPPQIPPQTRAFDPLSTFYQRAERPNDGRFPLVKPRDMIMANLVWDTMKEYSVSQKADGKHCYLLFVRGQGVFVVVDNKATRVKASAAAQELDVVLECEHLSARSPDEYVVFDCIYRDRPLLDEPQRVRLENAQEVVRALHHVLGDAVLSTKGVRTWETPAEFFEAAKLAMSEPYNAFGASDDEGLIFSPKGKYYNDHFTLKWKRPERLTIDFMVQRGSAPLLVGAKGTTRNTRAAFAYDGILFKPPVFPSPEVHAAIVGKIGEFRYDVTESRFVFVRERPDKREPNFVATAEGVMRLILQPITFATLTGEDLGLTRQYINREKSKIYDNLRADGVRTLLDIGSGRGGDVRKWFDLDVTAIEPKAENFAELVLRIRGNERRVKPIQSTIEAYESPKTFNAITSFNSLTLLDLSQLKRQLTRYSHPNTLMVFMFVDKVLLKQKIPRSTHNIEIEYLEGDKILISIDATGIVKEQVENLITVEALEAALPPHKKLRDYTLDGEPLQAADGKKLSESTRVVVYRRVGSGQKKAQRRGKTTVAVSVPTLLDGYLLATGYEEEYPPGSTVREELQAKIQEAYGTIDEATLDDMFGVVNGSSVKVERVGEEIVVVAERRGGFYVTRF